MKAGRTSILQLCCFSILLICISSCISESNNGVHPSIAFNGSELQDEDVIRLSGTSSSSEFESIISYRWSLPSGQSDVTLIGADTEELTARIPLTIEPASYRFKLTVKDTAGKSGSTTITIEVPPAVFCPACSDAQMNQMIAGGQVNLDNFSEVAALDNDVLVWGDRDSNKLYFHDLNNNTQADEVTLDSTPEELVYMPSHRSIYWATGEAAAVGRYRLDDRSLSTFNTSEVVFELGAGKHRLFYTDDSAPFVFPLYSISVDGTQVSHGSIDEDLFAYNVVRDEIVSASGDEGSTSGDVYRYTFDENDQIQQVQRSGSSFVTSSRSIDFSNDGTRLVVNAFRNGNEQTRLFDIASNDVLQINGEWQLTGYGGSRESAFSPDDRFLAVINDRVLKLFDSDTRELIAAYRLPDTSIVSASCGTDPFRYSQVGFSSSGNYVYVANRCEYYPQNLDIPVHEYEAPWRGFLLYRRLP